MSERVDLAGLHIVTYPAAVLRRRAAELREITPEVGRVAERMVELMREADGVGLAAPQVGLGWRLFVAEVRPGDGRSPDADPASATPGPVVYINPVLSSPQGAPVLGEEGCLSIPEVRGDVPRAPTLTITALDLRGRTFTQRGTGLLARCWQHEVDHLDGVLMLDRMTQAGRLANRAALRALEHRGPAR